MRLVTRHRTARRASRAAAAAVAALVVCFLAVPTAVATTRTTAPAGATLHLQTLGFCGGDDWEPDMAADKSGHIYVAITHFAGDPTCDPASAGSNHRIMIQVSGDGGQTFSDPQIVADAPGGLNYPSQADPAIAVDAKTGAVYVAFLAFSLDGFPTGVYVARSDDHGATFPQVVKSNAPGCNFCDHEKLLARGDDVYVAFTQGKNHFVSLSTDGGATFTQHLVDGTDALGFAENGVFDAAGNAWFSWADCRTPNCNGVPAADYRVSRTLAGTAATTFSGVIASAPRVPRCPYAVCGFSYFGPQDSIAIDAAGTIYLSWEGANDPNAKGSPPLVNLSRCSLGCLAFGWSTVNRVDDKGAYNCPNDSCYAGWPTMVGGAPGRIAVTWMDDRNDSLDGTVDHVDGWNFWYRTSTDGGTTWTAPGKRVSRYDPSRSESQPNGFLFPYGDYFGMVMNPNCAATQPAMVWGEGHNWEGGASAPGHIEYASFC